MGHDAMFDKLRMINGQWPRPGPWYAPNVGMPGHPAQMNHDAHLKKEGKTIFDNDVTKLTSCFKSCFSQTK